MLTSCKLTGSAADVAAYHASEENYYFSQGGEGLLPFEGNGKAPGHVFVHGKLSHRLGFAEGQAVTAAQLEHLLSGRDARGEEVGRAYKVMGIDLTFSAPKSVSIAALLTDRKPDIMAAHDHAVLETMAEIEQHASGTRLYIDKQIKPIKTGNLAYVTVRDGFNRDHDPHLHTHVVVMNMTETSRKVMTLDGRQIMRQDFNKLWGSMYRAKLACRLKEAGYSVSYTKKGELRLDSVSLELEREFSKRRAQIAAAKGAGERDFDAWRKTRKGKDHEVNKTEVLADWQERLARHADKTVDQNRQAALQEREAWFAEAKWSVEARQERAGERGDTEGARWQAAAGRATETCAAVTPQALVTEYLTELARGEGWAAINYAEAERRLAEQVRLGRIVATDDGRYTTWEMARVDRQCLQRQPGKAGLALDSELAKTLVKDYSDRQQYVERRGLSDRQAAAAVGILSSREATVVVQGDAGAGKTTMLAAINHAAAQQRWEVVGLAVQGVAARKLEQESGIKSQTLSSYLGSEPSRRSYQPGSFDRQPRLIIVDEASMLGSRDLAKLAKIADVYGDKVVLVGDQNQLQAIGAGRPFDRLVEAAEKSGNLLCLSENFRQRDPELRKAVDLARGGRMRESVDQLNRMGCVTEIDGAKLRRLFVAAQYGPNTLLITGSRESRQEINALVRDDLVKRGLIDRSTAGLHPLIHSDADGVKKETQLEFAVGEVVAFQRNEYREYDVRNGDRGRITGKLDSLLTIELESGRTLKLDLKKYSDLDYGYAMTTYKSQGLTFDKVVIDADTSLPVLQDQRNTYVQITRARLGVQIFTDDVSGLRHQAGILNFKRDTLELKTTLAEAIAREQSVRNEVLEERARLKELAQDAAASKTQEATQAARGAAEEIARHVEAAKEARPTRDPAVKAGKGKLRVYNAQVIEDACRRYESGPNVWSSAYKARLKTIKIRIDNPRLPELVGDKAAKTRQGEIEKCLNESGLKLGNKQLAAESLSLPENAEFLAEKYRPEVAIAYGLADSGRPLRQATEDLADWERTAVEHSLEWKGQAMRAADNPEGEIRIRNPEIVREAGPEATRSSRGNYLLKNQEAAETALRARKDLTHEEKLRIADCFNRGEYAGLLHDDRTQQALAAAAVKSGVRSLQQEVRRLKDPQLARVQIEGEFKIMESRSERERDRDMDFNSRGAADKVIKRACEKQFDEVAGQIEARTDLSGPEKLKVAQCLSHSNNAELFDRFRTPDSLVAAGLVYSGVRSLDTATIDLSQRDKSVVQEHAAERSRQAEMPRRRGLENGRDGPELCF